MLINNKKGWIEIRREIEGPYIKLKERLNKNDY